MHRKFGDPGTEADPELLAVEVLELFVAHRVEDAIQTCDTVVGAHPVHADEELLASPTGDDVLVTERATKDRTEAPKHLVARGVSKTVVDLLEVVDVDDH